MSTNMPFDPKPARPSGNILDLRRLIAEQQAEQTRHHRPKRLSLSRRNRGTGLHRPNRQPRDWRLFGREFMKFGLVLVVVGLVTAATIWTSRVVQARGAAQDQARQGVTALQTGFGLLGQSHGAEAAAAFGQAASAFHQAQTDISIVPSAAQRLPFVGDDITAADRLVTAGERAAAALRQLSLLLPADAMPAPAVRITDDGLVRGAVGLVPYFAEQRTMLTSSVQELVAAIDSVMSIAPSSIPSDYRTTWRLWQQIYLGLFGSSAGLDDVTDVLMDVLIADQPKDYLVVFQNNDELRPTGGFLGTLLLVEFHRGSFKILDAPGNGPYALSDIIAKKNLPPQPVTAIVPFWTFHDANWFLDVPTSAKMMLNMYEQDRGFRPDGILFFSPAVMEDILRITGPIRLAKYGVDITAENFVPATELQVEFHYDKARNNPKQFLIDLVPTMVEKLARLKPVDALRALAITFKNGVQGNLLLYSGTAATQAHIQQLGWDGAVLANDHDYLAVVDTNLGGGKTDRNIEARVELKVSSVSGLLRHVVTVTRTHRGDASDILDKSTNRDFIRLYAAPNAQLVNITGQTPPDAGWWKTPPTEAVAPTLLTETEGQVLTDATTGVRFTHESGKNVFGVWSVIAPGQSQTITFTYDTPWPTNNRWQLDWQHQPAGTPLRTWTVRFEAPSGTSIVSAAGPGQKINGRTVHFTTDSTVNRQFEVLMKGK